MERGVQGPGCQLAIGTVRVEGFSYSPHRPWTASVSLQVAARQLLPECPLPCPANICAANPLLLTCTAPLLQVYSTAVLSPRLRGALQAVSALALQLQGGPPVVPYFQYVHIAPWSVDLQYRPQRCGGVWERLGQDRRA